MTKEDIGIVELRSCPFCGGERMKIESCFVRCQSCCADGPVMDDVPDGSEEDASGAIWNKAIADLWSARTPDPIITEMVEALEAARRLIFNESSTAVRIDILLAKVSGK